MDDSFEKIFINRWIVLELVVTEVKSTFVLFTLADDA